MPILGTLYSNILNKDDEKTAYDRAIDDFCKTISINPYHAEAYYYLARVYKKKERFDKVIEICDKAIASGFGFIGLYATRGIALYKKGQYDKAIEDLNIFLLESNSADDGEEFYYRGLAYMKKGQHDKAVEDFDIACEMGYEEGCSKVKDYKK